MKFFLGYGGGSPLYSGDLEKCANNSFLICKKKALPRPLGSRRKAIHFPKVAKKAPRRWEEIPRVLGLAPKKSPAGYRPLAQGPRAPLRARGPGQGRLGSLGGLTWLGLAGARPLAAKIRSGIASAKAR